MKYMNRRFTVPAGSKDIEQGYWDSIFGSEEERKEKMKNACEETRERKKRRKTDVVQLVGDATDGFTSQNSDQIDALCAQHGIPSELVKGKTREVFERNAEVLSQGGDIQKDDR